MWGAKPLKSTLRARIALMPGSNHHANFVNRQDMCRASFVRVNGELEAVFVGCDGCSASASSEIGAGLTAHFAAETLLGLVQSCPVVDDVSAYHVLEILYRRIAAYLWDLIALQPQGRYYLERLDAETHGSDNLDIEADDRLFHVFHWIMDNLLFTIVGAYVGSDGIMVFQRGDGGCCVDDTLHVEDFRNVPPYLAYQFFPKRQLNIGADQMRQRNLPAELPPAGFTGAYFSGARRVAVFSDGMPRQHLDSIWDLVDPVDKWDYVRNRLQKEARRWHRNGELDDDLFLGVFVREQVNP